MAKYRAIYEFDAEDDGQARMVARAVEHQERGIKVISGKLVRIERESAYYHTISLNDEPTPEVAAS